MIGPTADGEAAALCRPTSRSAWGCSNDGEDVVLSAKTLPAVYETFEDRFGRKSSMDELITAISRYERISLLWVCAEIVARLQLWARPALQNRANYLDYLWNLFHPLLSLRLLRGTLSTSPVRLVFHRRQIGLVAKLALKHGEGKLDARLHRQHLGVLFLMANDNLHHDLLLTSPAHDTDQRDTYLRMVTEMLAVYEGSSPEVATMLTRGHLMLTRYSPELADAADYVDVAGLFQVKTGLSVPELEALIFATHSRFSQELSRNLVHQPGLLPLKREDFLTTAVPIDKVNAFLNFVSVAPDVLAAEIAQTDNGANDATAFRKYAMVAFAEPHSSPGNVDRYLMIDNMSFLERALSGPYWTANETQSQNLRTFWGAVFEKYVNELLSRACAGTKAQYIPDPRPDDNPNIQICDGLLVTEDSVVLIESKANMFRADSKYRGDRARLLQEVEKKWVHNEKGSKKGVEQLSAAVRLLFDDGNPETIFRAVEWSKVKNVYLCLVTLDTLGGTIGMSALLNTFLPDTLDLSRYPNGFISLLRCLDIASLERATAYFDTLTLPEIFLRWSTESPDLSAPLSMIELGAPRQNPWIQAEWEDVARQIVPLIFPGTNMDEFLAGAKESYERDLRSTPVHTS